MQLHFTAGKGRGCAGTWAWAAVRFALNPEGGGGGAKKRRAPAAAAAGGDGVQMAAKKAQADVLLHRLHYALPGRGAAAERRDVQGAFQSAPQAGPRQGKEGVHGRDGDFDADHSFGLGEVGRSAHALARAGCAGLTR
jgi:hypothetical protein